MKLLLTLIFFLTCSLAFAQNDTIYPAKRYFTTRDTITLVFYGKDGGVKLLTDGACSPKLVYHSQTLKNTGWPYADYTFTQMDCGLSSITIPNGEKQFYHGPQGTYRMVFHTEKGLIYSSEYTIVPTTNDSIYTTKSTYKIGEDIELKFNAKQGSILLETGGACVPKILYELQELENTGWPKTLINAQEKLACGPGRIKVNNGTMVLNKANLPGTYRYVFVAGGKLVFTDEFVVE